MNEKRKFNGGCHCGKVRYEVTADLTRIVSCNCSICSKKGYLLTFVAADEFTLVSGADVVTDYTFNKKKIHHLFCSVCGIESFGTGATPDGRKVYSVNVRCLDDIDLTSLTITSFDGKKL
jgi:hypothetical protein